MSKQTKRKSSQKKNLLEDYITKTHKEINDSAIKTLKPLNKDADIITIDDNIQPVLMVLSSDILSGSHDTIVGMAASYKITGLTTKSIQCGEVPKANIFDIGTIIPLVQSVMSSMPLINSAIGSYIECLGKNMVMQCNEISFNYGVAMNIGANFANPTKAPVLRNIGILIGNISQNIDVDENHKQFLSLVKTLPNNKYTKRLKEYVESIKSKEPKIEERSSPEKEEVIQPTNTKDEFEEAIKKATETTKEEPKIDIKFTTDD